MGPCPSGTGVATGMGQWGQCWGSGDGAMGMAYGGGDSVMTPGTGLPWWQVCPHAAVGHTEGTGGPSTSSSQWSWHGGGAGAAGAAPRGAPARAALTQAPQTCWGRLLGCGARRRLPCPVPHLAPWVHQGEPPLDPQDRPSGQFLPWGWAPGWAPGLLGMLVSHCVGTKALVWCGKGALGTHGMGTCCHSGTLKRNSVGSGSVCSGCHHLHQFMAESGAGTAVYVLGWLGGHRAEGY